MPRQKLDPKKFCKACGKEILRKRYGSRMEDRTRFLARNHCDQACANTRQVVQADTHRLNARKLKKRERCETCGKKSMLHVHHIDRNPANNSMGNLQVLCASCHLKLHWAEDREKRIQAMLHGAHMNRLYGGGSASLAAKRRRLPKSQTRASIDSRPVSRST